MKRFAISASLGLMAALAAPMGLAQDDAVPTETTEAAEARIVLHLHPFLTEEELFTLRMIAASDVARRALLGESDGYAAIAVAPLEGFLIDGAPAESAIALAQLPDAETARRDSRAACDSARNTAQACVVLIEAAPLR